MAGAGAGDGKGVGAGIGEGELGGVENPRARVRVQAGLRQARAAVNRVEPDCYLDRQFGLRIADCGKAAADSSQSNSMRLRQIGMCGISGGGVRGCLRRAAARRERREKQWYEKVDNQRRLLGALALAAGVTGTVAGKAHGVAAGMTARQTRIAARKLKAEGKG